MVKAPAPAAPRGSFRTDGTWNPEGVRDERFRFVESIVREMRRRPMSPQQVVAMILASVYADDFPQDDLDRWVDLRATHDWPKARATRSITETIRRRGYGTDGYWNEEGQWAPRR